MLIFKTVYDRWDKLAAGVNQSISAHSTYYPSRSKDGAIQIGRGYAVYRAEIKH